MSIAIDSYRSSSYTQSPRVYVIHTRRPRRKPQDQTPKPKASALIAERAIAIWHRLDLDPWCSQVEAINQMISVQKRCYLWAIATAFLTIAVSL